MSKISCDFFLPLSLSLGVKTFLVVTMYMYMYTYMYIPREAVVHVIQISCKNIAQDEHIYINKCYTTA